MIVANYAAAAFVFSVGLLCALGKRNLIKIVMGLSLMEASTYLLLVSLSYRKASTAPVTSYPPKGQNERTLAHGNVADPVFQNFCITAVVIGVAITAVFLVVVVRLAQHYRTLDTHQIHELRG